MITQNLDASSFPPSNLLLDIPQNQAWEILQAGNQKTFAKDDFVFHQGDRAKKCYFLLSGQLKLTKLHEDGREAVIRYISPGGLAAATAVLKENLYPVTALALCQATVISWDKEMLLKIMQQHPQVAINVLSIVLERLEDMQQRFLQISSEQTERRIARALLGIMQYAGTKTKEGIRIDLDLSREDLANFTGTTHYTVSRILSDWTRKGWIATYRRQIIVKDAHALRLCTESLP
ncbi:MAG: Crp/Fnr family transcriptional regulator [Thermodesulfobacteriota bacterium]